METGVDRMRNRSWSLRLCSSTTDRGHTPLGIIMTLGMITNFGIQTQLISFRPGCDPVPLQCNSYVVWEDSVIIFQGTSLRGCAILLDGWLTMSFL